MTGEELMDGRAELERFLRTDPRDVGCAQAMELLHVYAELAAAGQPVHQQYPGIAAHLRACGPCGEDFDGLLAALHDEATWPLSAFRRDEGKNSRRRRR